MSNDKEGQASVRGGSRIGPLANLPVFFKLGGKRVVLVGGGEPALWKAELLAASGAHVEVFAETFADGFSGLEAAPPSGQILLVRRRWTADDVAGAALAVGSFGDEADAAAFAAAARAAGVPVNVVDRPTFCDFQFGAIVNRSPLVVGISTDGAAPVFGQAIRSLIESLLPESFTLWAAAARDLRRDGARLGDTPDAKRRFWRRFTDLAIARSDRGPTQDDLDHLIAGQTAGPEPVAIIDVGEDVDELTLGAIRLLRAADDIFFDTSIPAAVMDFARREARRHPVASGQGNSREVGDALARRAAGGSRVVRLRLSTEPRTTARPT
ncbi:siroheme synthase [Hyphomicrobium sp.]|jgi:uroporphyrin-III C-methyltransferase/precorrin-2 dehydrogenase/sirohydrochlorin ferrochelatase|uniref:siroheme synthase n=1 Tax=Hyphomicrobium sp. TaxID=82 RepID=UPI0035616232